MGYKPMAPGTKEPEECVHYQLNAFKTLHHNNPLVMHAKCIVMHYCISSPSLLLILSHAFFVVEIKNYLKNQTLQDKLDCISKKDLAGYIESKSSWNSLPTIKRQGEGEKKKGKMEISIYISYGVYPWRSFF